MATAKIYSHIEDLNVKISDLKGKLAEMSEMSAEKLDNAIATSKNEFQISRDNMRARSDRTVSLLSGDLQRAQIGFDEKKRAIMKSISARKFKNEQERATAEVDDANDYAQYAVDFAIMAIDEAALAVLNAAKLEQSYDEKYGK